MVDVQRLRPTKTESEMKTSNITYRPISKSNNAVIKQQTYSLSGTLQDSSIALQ